MNLKLLQWLIAHRELLTQVIEAAKGFRRDLTAVAQWEIVDKIARLVIPVLTKEDLRAMYAWDPAESDEVSAFALGSEYSALGLDWAFVVNTLLPILRLVIAALETLVDTDE